MDILSIVGIALALGAILGGNALEGGHLSSLMQLTAFIIVAGGTVGAVMLQSDEFIRPVGTSKHLIEAPGSYEVEKLTGEQQAEYIKTFSTDGELEQIRRYQYVRISSLQRSIIEFCNEDLLERTKEECQLLSKLQRRKNLFIGFCECIGTLCDYLLEVTEKDRKERLAILSSLHKWAHPIIEHCYTHGCRHEIFQVAEQALISPRASYCQFAMLPLEDLKQIRDFNFNIQDQERTNSINESFESY